MRRREFIAGLGGAAAWPLAARGQQPGMPVIGLLNGVSFEAYAPRIAAFREGLNERGFVEGQNVSVIYRSAEGQDDASGLPLGINSFAAAGRNGGLIMVPPPPAITDRETISRLAAENRLPAIFQEGRFVTEGGLMA
jgi:hypothetical protein